MTAESASRTGPALSPKNFAERLRAQREAAERLIGKRAATSPQTETGKAVDQPGEAIPEAAAATWQEPSDQSLAQQALNKASATAAGVAGAAGAAAEKTMAAAEALRNEPDSNVESSMETATPAQPFPAHATEVPGGTPQATMPEPAMRPPHTDMPVQETEQAPAMEQAATVAPAPITSEPEAPSLAPQPTPSDEQDGVPGSAPAGEVVQVQQAAQPEQAAQTIDFSPHESAHVDTPPGHVAHGGYGAHDGHDDRHDYASAYAELEHGAAQQAGSRKPSLMLMLGIFIAIAALAAAVVFLLFRPQSPQPAGGDVPVIQPPGAPAKVKPDQPEAAPPPMQPRRRKLIYDRITDDAADKDAGTQPSTPPAAAPEPVPAPPPLPPPPSMGDDQGQAPVTPAPRQQEQQRIAQPVGINKAVAAGSSELARAADAFISGSGGEQGATGGTGASFTASHTAGSDELTNAARAFAHRMKDTASTAGRRVAAASTGVTISATAAAAPEGMANTPEGRAATSKPAARTPRKAQALGANANTMRKPPLPPKKPARLAAQARATPDAPTAETAQARTTSNDRGRRAASQRGPIPLPGVVAPVADAPATTASTGRAADDVLRGLDSTTPPASQPVAVTQRKRMNFNAGQRPAAAQVAPAPVQRVANITPATTRRAAAAPVRAPARQQVAAPAPAARTAPAATGSGGYVVQLAAYRSQQDAQRAWQRVRARHSATLGGLQPIISRKDLGDAGTFFRLSVGPLPSRAAANRLCQRLIARGEPDCLIRKR